MPVDPSQIESLLKLGAHGALIFGMAIAIYVLWNLAAAKDKQIIIERDKREELIKEVTKALTSTFEATERMLEAVRDLRNGMFNDRHNNSN